MTDAVPAPIDARFRRDLPARPRLLLTAADEAALRKRVAADARLAGLQRLVLETAEAMCGFPPVTRVVEGRRMLAVSRDALHRVLTLGLAHRLTGEQKFFAAARDVLLAVSAFDDWNPSHFLDTAEMTAAAAVGYDWLHDLLSPSERQTVRDAIIEKGLRPSFDPSHWWVRGNNNWNQVCHAGMVMGAVAVGDDEPELRARIAARAVENLPLAMAAYAPGGAYPEGPMYWGYATTFNVLLIDTLEKAFGSDFGLTAAPGFMASADYMLHVTGPSGTLFNYADCRLGDDAFPAAALFWMAGKRNDPTLLASEAPRLAGLLAGNLADDRENLRFLPLTLIWADALPDAKTPLATHFIARGPTPVAMHRSSWDAGATYLAIKGGSAAVSHAHMDAGSFVLEAAGERWAIDLGMQEYHSLEAAGLNLWDRAAGADRWNVFRIGAASHNVLTFDGRPPSVTGHATIVSSTPSETVVDCSAVYEGQVAAHVRTATLQADGTAVLRDDITTLPAAATAKWTLATRATVDLLDDGSATLTQNGKTMRVTVEGPGTPRFVIHARDPRPNAFDAPNPGVTLVGFFATIAPGTSASFSVRFERPVGMA